MKKMIALGIAAMLALAVGCSNKKDPAKTQALGPTPTSPAGVYVPSGAGNAGPIDVATPPTTPGAREITDVGPGPGVQPGPKGNAKYTVQRGDTLWSIATRTYGDGKQYKRIVAANGIKNDSIKVGQTLVLP